MADRHQDFNPKHIAVVDLETTGLNPEIARVIQLAVILVRYPLLEIESMRSCYIWPGTSAISQATTQAMEINKISVEKLSDEGIGPAAVLVDAHTGIFTGIDWGETVLASWGADFEAKFLTAEFRRLGVERPPFNYRLLDIRSICGWADAFGVGRFEGWNYSSMLDFAQRHGLKTYFDALEVNRQHDALYDARVSLECLRYAAMINEHGYEHGRPR